MANKEKEAYYKGRSDNQRYHKHDSIADRLGDLVNPTYNPVKGHEEAYKAGTSDKVIVRFNNVGHSPKPTLEMRLSTDKSNCKADYGCCGQLP